MRSGSRNGVVWAVVVAIAAAIWFFAARTRLHFIDPVLFLVVLAIAAAGLTALLWWEIVADDSPPPSSTGDPP